MGLVLSPVAIPALVTLLAGLLFAGFILFRSAPRTTNRLLALVVALEALGLGSAAGLLYVFDTPEDAAGAQAIFVTCFIALPFLYLLLLSYLPSPLARPLRSKGARVALVLAALAAEAYWLSRPEAFIPAMVRPWYAPWEAIIGPSFELALAFGGLVSIYAVAIALTAVRAAAPGTPARAQAKAYAVAFVFRDAYIFCAGIILPALVGLPPTGTIWDLAYVLVAPSLSLVFMAVLSYGILRTQLFDIDLRLKLTLSRGAVAGTFVAVFFAVAELAQSVLTDALGWALGGLAAGLLLFALSPLQRAAERFANAALPHASGSEEYVAARKFFVYRAALESALAEGGMSGRERSMLASLQRELGIRAEDAAQMEREMRAVPA